jgi:steroid delta-isomerase-like uncharacterized protein
MPDLEANKAVMRRWVEEMDKHNWSVFQELLAPNYICHYPGSPGPLTRDEYEQSARMFYEAFPDLYHEIEDVFAEGDRVAIRMSNRGTHKGDLLGTPATGKTIGFTAIFIGRIAGGKVVEAWGEADLMGLMQQVGAIPSHS